MKTENLSVTRKAYGKVNLSLRITGRRQDGYHEISTVMVPVRLYDLLHFRLGGDGLRILCPKMPLLSPKDNLVMKAALAVFDASGSALDMEIIIEKTIPAGGGMGGGSSDAAATLLAVNGMLPIDRQLMPGRLLKIAASIGADVPFFLGCNANTPAWTAAWCTGTGVDIHPLPDPRKFSLVLTIPDFPVNTAQAYRDWDEGAMTSDIYGDEKEKDTLNALISGDAALLARSLVNDLERPASLRHPAIVAIKRRLKELGALGAVMTGSGSSVFGVCCSPDHSQEIAGKLDGYKEDLGLTGVFPVQTGCES